jgi:regulatory factor X
MLSPIPATSLTNLRQLALKMEKILLAALEDYGNTFVEPKVELGARFGHLICTLIVFSFHTVLDKRSTVRFLDIYQVTQALNTVLTNHKQLTDMRRSWEKVDFESVRNQSALVCNCRHEELVQLLEVEFVALLDSLTKTNEPVREVMAWADKCCDRLMGSSRIHNTPEERGGMSSRSILIRWGYVTSQVMRDLVRFD